MCEGPNELKIINILLENQKLKFSSDDLLELVPYHARQIKSFAAVKAALNLYPDEVWCCTIKVDIGNTKGQYIEKDKQEATKDGSESTKIQHGI